MKLMYLLKIEMLTVKNSAILWFVEQWLAQKTLKMIMNLLSNYISFSLCLGWVKSTSSLFKMVVQIMCTITLHILFIDSFLWETFPISEMIVIIIWCSLVPSSIHDLFMINVLESSRWQQWFIECVYFNVATGLKCYWHW